MDLGARHRPYSLRSCKLALRAVNIAGGYPRGGGGLVPWRGVSGVRCSPSPSCEFLRQAAGDRYPHVVGNRARPVRLQRLFRCCVPQGWCGLPAVVPPRRCEGRLGSGAVPLPAICPWGSWPGPVARASKARGVPDWGPAQTYSACCCEMVLLAVGAAGGGLRAGVQAWGPGTGPLACVPFGTLRAEGLAGDGSGGHFHGVVRGV